jgi:hypothetical protein
MKWAIILLIMIVSIIPALAEPYIHYYDGNGQAAGPYYFNQLEYIENPFIARWRQYTVTLSWIEDTLNPNYPTPWWENPDPEYNPELFTMFDIDDRIGWACTSWYYALPSNSYLYDIYNIPGHGSWSGDIHLQFVHSTGQAQQWGLRPYGNFDAVAAPSIIVEINNNNEEEARINGGTIYLAATDGFFANRFWQMNTGSSHGTKTPVPLETVITHEIGHTLGLKHIQNDSNAIMQPNIPSNYGCTTYLTYNDVTAFQVLYNMPPGSDADDFVISNNHNLIHQNHPNPFNPSTTISYSLADNIKNPKIEIYNIKGQLVRALELPAEQGTNTVNWDGRNKQDNPVSSEVYLYRLVNNGKAVQSRKMMMLK